MDGFGSAFGLRYTSFLAMVYLWYGVGGNCVLYTGALAAVLEEAREGLVILHHGV